MRAGLSLTGFLLFAVLSCASPQKAPFTDPNLFTSLKSDGSSNQPTSGDLVRVDAAPANGFYWPYYLYVPPKELLKRSRGLGFNYILVLPNNSGGNDSFEIHDKDAKERTERSRRLANELGVIIVRPVFPRSKTEWWYYTHALDRDTMLMTKPDLKRPDVQLIAMVEDARRRLKKDGLNVEQRVLLWGFSASGMFANRFALLHPERVQAVAVGSPGGWPIAPTPTYRGMKLRYPIGTGDLTSVAGKVFDKDGFKRPPMFFYMGDQDTNDSVVFTDGYDPEDKNLIFELFGDLPVKRWAIAEKLYREAGCNCRFKLYPGVEHTQPKDVLQEVMVFLKDSMRNH